MERFTVRPSDMEFKNSTRCSSWVRYEGTIDKQDAKSYKDVDEEDQFEDDDLNRSQFRRVSFFFTIDLARVVEVLAFIESYPVYADGTMLYRVAKDKTKEHITPVDSIKELIGFVVKGERRYAVGKYGLYRWKREA